MSISTPATNNAIVAAPSHLTLSGPASIFAELSPREWGSRKPAKVRNIPPKVTPKNAFTPTIVTNVIPRVVIIGNSSPIWGSTCLSQHSDLPRSARFNCRRLKKTTYSFMANQLVARECIRTAGYGSIRPSYVGSECSADAGTHAAIGTRERPFQFNMCC